MKKKLFYGLLALCFALQAQMCYVSAVTMYSADGREIQVSAKEVEAQRAVGWFTSLPVTMYAADGRELLVSEDEVALYQTLGWYSEPLHTVYAPYDRSLTVPAAEVQAYVNVGWFTTYDEAVYNEVIPKLQEALAVSDYNRVIDLCDDALGRFSESETAFAEDITGTMYAAMDAWRAVAKQPIVFMSTYMTDYYGTPRINIVMRNIGYREISAVDLEFNCCNAFGEPVKYNKYGNSLYNGWANKMEFESLETQTWHWDLYGYSEADMIKNLKLIRVAFSDGTVWYK